MIWVAISGSWRKTNKEIENKVRKTVREIIKKGNGVVTGGALNVDYFATDEALKYNPLASHIKIFLPTSLNIYSKHYLQRATEGVITNKQAIDLIFQLTNIKKINPQSLIENKKNKVVNESTYFERNSHIVTIADQLIAFQVNKSAGTMDTINKARKKGIPVTVFFYNLL